jgi:hypothetical protein
LPCALSHPAAGLRARHDVECRQGASASVRFIRRRVCSPSAVESRFGLDLATVGAYVGREKRPGGCRFVPRPLLRLGGDLQYGFRLRGSADKARFRRFVGANGDRMATPGCVGSPASSRQCAFAQFRHGAPGRNRTCGTWFRKPLLYPLSYEGAGVSIRRGPRLGEGDDGRPQAVGSTA